MVTGSFEEAEEASWTYIFFSFISVSPSLRSLLSLSLSLPHLFSPTTCYFFLTVPYSMPQAPVELPPRRLRTRISRPGIPLLLLVQQHDDSPLALISAQAWRPDVLPLLLRFSASSPPVVIQSPSSDLRFLALSLPPHSLLTPLALSDCHRWLFLHFLLIWGGRVRARAEAATVIGPYRGSCGARHRWSATTRHRRGARWRACSAGE